MADICASKWQPHNQPETRVLDSAPLRTFQQKPPPIFILLICTQFKALQNNGCHGIEA